jgi:hypothetical protein
VGVGLEEKRITYALKNKNMDPEKLKLLSKLAASGERYGGQLRRIMQQMREEANYLTNSEIELRNLKETKAAEILLDMRTKLTKAEGHLRSAINSLI